jgi:hypothetical protein
MTRPHLKMVLHLMIQAPLKRTYRPKILLLLTRQNLLQTNRHPTTVPRPTIRNPQRTSHPQTTQDLLRRMNYHLKMQDPEA